VNVDMEAEDNGEDSVRAVVNCSVCELAIAIVNCSYEL
jgi:hypothetical protein